MHFHYSNINKYKHWIVMIASATGVSKKKKKNAKFNCSE